MSIEFIQFMYPNASRVPVSIEMPEEIEKLANELKAEGCRFEIEALPGLGIVNMDIQPPGGEGTFAVEVVPNGPEVVEAVTRLVRNAHEVWKKGPPWSWDEDPEDEEGSCQEPH